MKSGSFSHKDPTPLSVKELRAILNQIPESKADLPVAMSCDEEGNDTSLKLASVDVAKSGQVLLWPAC
jgi:hypothetical protein